MEESITGRVRTLAEVEEAGPASLEEALIRMRQMNAQMNELNEQLSQTKGQLRDRDRKLFLSEVVMMGGYDDAMRGLRDLDFPPQEYSIDFVNNDPSQSSMSSRSQKSNKEVEMSKFRYASLSAPQLCPWKEMALPASTKELVVRTLFGGNETMYVDVVGQFASDLERIRDVFGYYRVIGKGIGENKGFRPLFMLWLGALIRAIPADGELSEWEVLLKEHESKPLAFQALLHKESGPPQRMTVNGHEDFVIRQRGQILVLGELKSPFAALCPDANLSLRRSALSQMNAKLQGFMAAADVSTIDMDTTADVTAAAPPALNVPSEDRSAPKKKSFVSLITDGFVLRVSFGCPHVRLVENQQLPPVYTSDDASFLDPRRFTELMLFAVAAATEQPDVDFAEATKDVFSVELGPANASGDDAEQPPSSASDEKDCLTWDDSDEEFLEEERIEVGRLNALLDPSYLSEFTLQKLGKRHPICNEM